MKYYSTRQIDTKGYSGAEAILRGIAADGGLLMPERIPTFSLSDFATFSQLSYPALAARLLHSFLPEYTEQELLEDASAAYGEMSFPRGALEVKRVDRALYALELWHGPTCAFKDLALQLMPHLFKRAKEKMGEERTALILTATSGDTGKAALEGFKNIPGIKIQVFYPQDGTSLTQRLQMVTQEGDNVSVYGINGNFDDAQRGVKRLFGDEHLAEVLNEKGVFLTSANSINFGRLVPQIVYYVYAYLTLVKNGAIGMGDKLDIVVPTGNFGNILAAYMTKRMGLPVGRLVCASNQNNILYDFFSTGIYDRNRPFYTTISPSMDILVSSNLERLLYLALGAQKTAQYMQSLAQTGRFALSYDELALLQSEFDGDWTSEDETKDIIRLCYDQKGYLIDPHTAVAMHSACKKQIYDAKPSDLRRTLVVSTASPFKFTLSVLQALGQEVPQTEAEAMKALSAYTGHPIPCPLLDLDQKEVRFAACIAVEDMDESMLRFAEE
ncbi:MAG: threonine synthase [Clostridia bacterium]|nr:threonine synthase [Clostridia bacterium]